MKIDGFGKAGLHEIAEVEYEYSISFPENYKIFLERYNGGVLYNEKKNAIYINDVSEKIVIDILFGVGKEAVPNDIKTWMDAFRDEPMDSFVFIGYSIQEGFLLMNCEGEDSGIYYWDDKCLLPGSTDEGNTFWIAENFTDLLNKLTDEEGTL